VYERLAERHKAALLEWRAGGKKKMGKGLRGKVLEALGDEGGGEE
jgi:hypothetical protein